MENNSENKLKFFAQYFGQRIMKNNTFFDKDIVYPVTFSDHVYRYSHVYYLELRSIESITDDECLEFLLYDTEDEKIEILQIKRHRNAVKIDYKYNLSKSDILTYSTFTIYFNHLHEGFDKYQLYEKLDWLRSKSFLVPFMNLTTDQILSYGWAKIKEQ